MKTVVEEKDDKETTLQIVTEIDLICRGGFFDKPYLFTDGLLKIREAGTCERLHQNEIFYTTPILYEVDVSVMDLRQQLDLIFEILLTLVVLNQNGIVHNDLHDENIMMQRVNYHRRYTINGHSYITRFNYLPVIIDFGGATFTYPMKEFSMDDTAMLITGDQYYPEGALRRLSFDNEVVDLVQGLFDDSDSFSILLDPMFDSIKNTPVEDGIVIKGFSAMQV
jgi:serine/threonine protein kinase